jgi:chromosome segregation ATPase
MKIFDDNSKPMTEPDNAAESELVLAKRKNAYLLQLLSELRSSENGKAMSTEPSSDHSTAQLERTYKKALGDYASASKQLESHMAHCAEQSTRLRDRLREKEDKAENIMQTLAKYREDIALQSSYKTSKPFDMDHFEELVNRSQRLDHDVEKERLKNTTHKVEISQLEQKIKKKNELAGGISNIEYQNLANDIKKSDAKLKHCDKEIQKNTTSKRNMLSMESKLQAEIQIYREKNAIAEQQFQNIDIEIERKRSHLSRLDATAKEIKKKIGYDAADICVYLKTRVINEDFASSKDELTGLHEKLDDLKSVYATLVE